MTRIFDTSDEVTKKKVRDINAEPEMIELKRMIRSGELDAGRTIATMKGGSTNGQHGQSNGSMEVEG